MSLYRHGVAALCLAAAITALAPDSAAEPSDEDRAAAQALFEEAQALKKDEQFEEACEKFAGSQKLDPAMGTQLNLADCYERIGRTASAWINFLEVASKAKKAGSKRRQEIAEERADALKPQLSRLQVEIAEPLEGMVVERNGVAISEPKWGSAVPVDPNTYELTARAPGMKPWSEIVTIEGGGDLVEVIVPRLEPAPEGDGAGTDDGADEGSGDGVQIGLGIALSAVGLGGMALGTAFTLIASSKHDESLAYCPDDPDKCTAPGVELRDEAQSAQTISIIGFAVGGAALVGGVVLLVSGLTGGDEAADEQSAAALQLCPYLSPELAGLGLSGRF